MDEQCSVCESKNKKGSETLAIMGAWICQRCAMANEGQRGERGEKFWRESLQAKAVAVRGKKVFAEALLDRAPYYKTRRARESV